MTQLSAHQNSRSWHTDDFLVRIARNESVAFELDASTDGNWGDSRTSADAHYGVRTLALLAGDPVRAEQLAALRDETPPERDLVVFAARTATSWAFDALAGRLTDHTYDWQSLRATILNLGASNHSVDPILGRISLHRLYGLSEALYERRVDPEAHHALIEYIAARVAETGKFDKGSVSLLIEHLLRFDAQEPARALLHILKKNTWVRHCLYAELEHPRFGGTFDAMLRLLNEPYRRVGIEPIELIDDEVASPFHKLVATAQSELTDGPLVSVVMTTASPGAEIKTAVRSLIGQSYQNWELIITDDGSDGDVASLLDEVAALDARIRVIYNPASRGTFVRRNEAIQSAQGLFVTMLDSSIKGYSS